MGIQLSTQRYVLLMVKATNRKSNTLAPPLGVIPKPLQMMLLLLPQHARVQLSAQTVSIEPNAKTHELQYINGYNNFRYVLLYVFMILRATKPRYTNHTYYDCIFFTSTILHDRAPPQSRAPNTRRLSYRHHAKTSRSALTLRRRHSKLLVL